MQPILLATDGSPSAEAATNEAIDLARTLDLPLVVASVAHDTAPIYGGYYGYPEIAADFRKVQVDHVKEVLARIEARAAEAGVDCTVVPLEGMPGMAICDAAKDNHVRLIVIGAHGWGRFGRLIHGSVSTYVLHHADAPVLVVQGEEHAQDKEAKPAAGAAS